MPFVPIQLEEFIAMHVRANPWEDPDDLRDRVREAIAARRAGETCSCGDPIWVLGSAVMGHGCFTCITMEAVPDDYEISDVCGEAGVRERGP